MHQGIRENKNDACLKLCPAAGHRASAGALVQRGPQHVYSQAALLPRALVFPSHKWDNSFSLG